MVIIIFVVAIVLLVISLRITILNRIFTILLHIGRLIFTILCMSSAILIADGDYVIAAVVFGCFTASLTLYGIGASAFDDTRQETGNILMNPIEGGGYKLCAEVTGDSPLGTFISSLIWSAIVGGVVGFLLALLGDSSENMMYIIVLILSIIGIIRGIASLIQGITEL